MDLTTNYMGLTLPTPIIVGSSGLTDSVDKIVAFARHGAGAIVLKSIFEEEILFEYDDILKEAQAKKVNLEQFDYYDYHLKDKKLSSYISLVEAAKQAVDIPVIASINCVYSHEWTAFAYYLQNAGADALELNMSFLPSDFKRSAREQEEAYFRVIDKVFASVSIPVALKISPYFTDLGPMIQRLSETGIKGLVLFNRFFSPDFDIDKLEVKPSFVFSSPSDLSLSLRWIAVMANKVNCDLAASTGVHEAAAVIKQLLAGADTVQVVSCLYKNGPQYLKELLDGLQTWMTTKRYHKISDFKSKLSQEHSTDPAVYERAQFMRYFGGKKNVIL